MHLVDRLSSLLSLPGVYRLFVRAVARDLQQRYVAEYIKPSPGDVVLDIGCGPGDMFSSLSGVKYTGLDISHEYIAAARKRFGDKARFLCNDVGLATIEQERGRFDLVLATGVLHHLDDERAAKLFELARLALRPGGRLITYDGCYVPEQSKLARWVLSKDRGKFVRRREEYLRLASVCFSKIEPHIRHDLLRIPYTHLIMYCSN